MDTYDQLNRIATAPAGTLWGYSYGYDNWGNLTSMTPATGVSNSETSLSISANTSNQLSATGLVYDADGRMTTDNVGNSYTYDAEGQLIQYGDGTNHHFDAAGRLVQEWNGATGVVHSFSYGLNGRREATFDTSGNVVSNVTYAGSQPLMYYTPSSGTYTYEYQNQVGTESARETTGQVTVYTSLPYGDAPGTHLEGSINTTSGADTDEYHFAGMDVGQSYIPFQQSQIHHAQFRDYYSGSGQWMSPDPYDGSYDATNPQSLNRYTYSLSSPLSFSDPSGASPCTLDGFVYEGNCASLGDNPGVAQCPENTNCAFIGGGSGAFGNQVMVRVDATGAYYYIKTADGSILSDADVEEIGLINFNFDSGALAPNNPTAPCTQSSANGKALDYSQPLFNGMTTMQHIQSRHMPGVGKQNVSTYWTQDWSAVGKMNYWTFVLGTQSLDRGSVVFDFTFPNFRGWLTPGSGLQNGIGYDSNGNDTLTNHLVVMPDCKTVVTSYPIG